MRPPGEQVQLRVEHLPVQFLARQALPAALTDDAKYRFGALHFAYLPVTLKSFHLCPFALRAAFPPSLAGRYPCDYYGHSVTIGLAPLR
jgi:hypothetical protein